MNQVDKLIEKERWYLSEHLGYDCTTTAMGLCALSNRITTLIQFSFGKYIHKLDE